MVDHAEMIELTILAETSITNGEHFPVKGKISRVAATLPKIFVRPLTDRFMNNNVQYSEFFDVFLEASTLANLETYIADILGASSDASSGYVWTTANYPYWIHLTLVEKIHDERHFAAKIECEGRWAI